MSPCCAPFLTQPCGPLHVLTPRRPCCEQQLRIQSLWPYGCREMAPYSLPQTEPAQGKPSGPIWNLEGDQYFDQDSNDDTGNGFLDSINSFGSDSDAEFVRIDASDMSNSSAGGPIHGNVLNDTVHSKIPSLLPMPHPTSNVCFWPGCTSLQKEFVSSPELDFHIQTFHMQHCPWPTCTVQKSFRRRSDLLRHMESVHSGIRRFACNFPGCSKSYARSDKLTAHKRSHGNRVARRPILDINTRLFNAHSSFWSTVQMASFSPISRRREG